MAVGKPVCAACGYDPRTVPLETSKAREVLGEFDADPDATPLERRLRERAKTRRQKSAPPVPKCSACGYVLRGLKPVPEGVRCPECGKVNHLYERSAQLEEESRETARRAWRTPLLHLVWSIPVMVLFLGSRGWINGGMEAAKNGIIGSGPSGGWVGSIINVGVGLGAFAGSCVACFVVVLTCALMWTGLATTIRILAVQVCGMTAVAAATWMLLAAIPLPLPWWAPPIAAGGVFAYLLSQWQDLYAPDVILVSIAILVVHFLVALTVLF